MTERRPYGTGSIGDLAGGRKRARVYIGGEQRHVGVYTSPEQAESALRGILEAKAAGQLHDATTPTLREWGEKWFARRELEGVRDVANEQNRWVNHVLRARFADHPIEQIRRRDVKAWIDDLRRTKVRGSRKRMAWQTIKHVVKLLRGALAAAVDDEILERNVAHGIKIERPATEDTGWTFLLPDEQRALMTCETIPQAERWLVGFAIATGLRQGEQWALELRDLHLEEQNGEGPHVFVRWGSPGKPPKNGKARKVFLSGEALACARAWVAHLPRYLRGKTKDFPNEHQLVFPTARGCRRREKKPPRGWTSWLAAAGLGDPSKRHDRRHVRWHDLRHTCGSSLVAGWWEGGAWTLLEVRDHLGHSSVKVTERYAHLASSELARRAAATGGLNKSESRHEPEDDDPEPRGRTGRATVDSNHWPSAPEADPLSSDSGDVRLKSLVRVRLEALAGAFLRAAAGRNRFAVRYGTELATAVLEAVGGHRSAGVHEPRAATTRGAGQLQNGPPVTISQAGYETASAAVAKAEALRGARRRGDSKVGPTTTREEVSHAGETGEVRPTESPLKTGLMGTERRPAASRQPSSVAAGAPRARKAGPR
jgi:integrase